MVYIIGEKPELMGMTIIDKLDEDKHLFLKNGDKNGISVCRVLIGEIQRDPDKDYSDDNVTKILRMVRKQTMKNPKIDYLMLQLIDTYIEPMVSDVEIEAWMTSCGYDEEFIHYLGKKAYRLIGEAKKHFKDKDFNSDHIKNIIDEAIDATA